MFRALFVIALVATYALQKQKQELEEEHKKNVTLQKTVDRLKEETVTLQRTVDDLQMENDRVWRKVFERDDVIHYNRMKDFY
jgi:hypothetical protein